MLTITSLHDYDEDCDVDLLSQTVVHMSTDWNRTIHLMPFYLETGICQGRVRVRVRVRVSVWVGVMVMDGGRIKYEVKIYRGMKSRRSIWLEVEIKVKLWTVSSMLLQCQDQDTRAVPMCTK